MRLLLLAILAIALANSFPVFASYDSRAKARMTDNELELTTNIVNQINKEFPPNAEAQLKVKNIRLAIKNDKNSLKLFNTNYSLGLFKRAEECIEEMPINKIKSVKDQFINFRCLEKQDEKLISFLEIQHVLALLQSPALFAVKPFGLAKCKKVKSTRTYQYNTIGASEANVSLLEAGDDLFTISMPSGEKISDIKKKYEDGALYKNVHISLLSPNGRIVALRDTWTNDGIELYSADSGELLYQNKDIRKIHEWLPEISALVVKDEDGYDKIFDLKSGEIKPIPMIHGIVNKVTKYKKSPVQILVETSNTLFNIELNRTENGLEGSVIKTYWLANHNLGLQQMLMENSKTYLYFRKGTMVALDLDTEEEKIWEMGKYILDVAKLSESTLLVQTEKKPQTRMQVFNIDNSTFSPVSIEATNSMRGKINDIRGRSGYLLSYPGEIWIGDKVITEDPVLWSIEVEAHRDYINKKYGLESKPN